MPHQNAAHHDRIVGVVRTIDGMAAVRENGLGALPEHFLDGRRGILKIIRSARVSGGECGGYILQIRQPDIHQSLQGPYGLDTLVAPCVVHDRNREPCRLGAFQGGDQQRHKMFRGHEVDIVGPLFLQIQKNLRHPPRSHFREAGERRCPGRPAFRERGGRP